MRKTESYRMRFSRSKSPGIISKQIKENRCICEKERLPDTVLTVRRG